MVECPWSEYRDYKSKFGGTLHYCKGDMEKVSHYTTNMGSTGVDKKEQTEVWNCSKCGRRFERRYKWSLGKNAQINQSCPTKS